MSAFSIGSCIMRRSDREITAPKAIEEFISNEQIIRIAFYDDGEIYIVPVNYGYINNTFYFHGAKAGRKYELSKNLPSVGFEIDGKYKLVTSDCACEYTAEFQSVIGTGVLSIVEEKEEKIIGLNALMKQTTGKFHWDYSEKMLDTVAVFKLEVRKMSCKAK